MTAGSFTAKREEMVFTQIQRRGIRDPLVIDALRTVPREEFVPPELLDLAYADQALPIGSAQTISQPYMVAVMTASLHVGPSARVLEIGTGSGYQAAILSRIAREVLSIERQPELAAAARDRLLGLGCTNVTVIVGDGSVGLSSHAPYDGILVAAAAPEVPSALTAQLAENGRLVIPVGTAWHQDLVTVVRRGDGFDQTVGDACVFVPLVGRFGWPQ
jgi:protein-L-isoaspartate(D-aspartate) O-methyltransferase